MLSCNIMNYLIHKIIHHSHMSPPYLDNKYFYLFAILLLVFQLVLLLKYQIHEM